MMEEMDFELTDIRLFDVFEMSDRKEYTFWQKADFAIHEIHLMEGQRIKWFTDCDAARLNLAYGFNKIIDDFFSRRPWRKSGGDKTTKPHTSSLRKPGSDAANEK